MAASVELGCFPIGFEADELGDGRVLGYGR